jgi:hypothetical protein
MYQRVDPIRRQEMHEIVKSALWVNGVPIDLNAFVEEFLGRTVVGAVSCLRGAENLKGLELRLSQNELIITVNNAEISLTQFPKEVITATIVALVSSLKGVDKIDSLKITAEVS